MTKGKKFKQLVRERMARTGESYTAARLALLIERDGVQVPDEVKQMLQNKRAVDRHRGE